MEGMMAESTGYERRRERRVGVDKLPENLKKFTICFGSNNSMLVDTLDLSVGGISLLVPINARDIESYSITLTSLDNKISLKEDILGIRPLSDSSSRISIMFSKNNSYKEYFHNILSRL
jgi:hypothetical protein